MERLGLVVFDGGEAPAAGAGDSLGEREPGWCPRIRAEQAISSPSVALSGRGKEEEYQPFLYSDGFPPVPAKLVWKFLRLEFVDMAELLRDNIEAERRQGRQREATGVPMKQQQRREVPDILSWIQCFGIYVSVVASKFPERVPRMLDYQTTLVREARRCRGGGWAAYDTAFWQQAATDKECDWSKLNSSLYPVTFMAQATGRGTCYSHCLEADHVGDECALSPKPRQERPQVTQGVGLPARPVSDGIRAEPPRGSGRRYLHICQRCQGDDHPACTGFPAGGGICPSEQRTVPPEGWMETQLYPWCLAVMLLCQRYYNDLYYHRWRGRSVCDRAHDAGGGVCQMVGWLVCDAATRVVK